MYKAYINDKEFSIEHKEDALWLNGEKIELDRSDRSDSGSHIIYNHKGFKVYFIEFEEETKTVHLLINNKAVAVQIKDKTDLLLEKMGLDSVSSAKGGTVKAPMPGLVLDIKVKAGQEIKKGDPLLILEAMKMENVIKSSMDGIVSSIQVSEGNAVEKNEVLIEIE